MDNRQIYEDIETIILEIDTLTKDQIKDKLNNILIDPCRYCGIRCNTIPTYGREINPQSSGGPSESYIYNLCSNCDRVLSWSM